MWNLSFKRKEQIKIVVLGAPLSGKKTLISELYIGPRIKWKSLVWKKSLINEALNTIDDKRVYINYPIKSSIVDSKKKIKEPSNKTYIRTWSMDKDKYQYLDSNKTAKNNDDDTVIYCTRLQRLKWEFIIFSNCSPMSNSWLIKSKCSSGIIYTVNANDINSVAIANAYLLQLYKSYNISDRVDFNPFKDENHLACLSSELCGINCANERFLTKPKSNSRSAIPPLLIVLTNVDNVNSFSPEYILKRLKISDHLGLGVNTETCSYRDAAFSWGYICVDLLKTFRPGLSWLHSAITLRRSHSLESS